MKVFLFFTFFWSLSGYGAAAPIFDADAFEKLRTEKKPKSVEEFISLLPESLRASFTLFKNSGSLQKSSALEPRAIAFTPSANLLLTFTGHNQVGGNSIEVMSFIDGDNPRYELREYTFDPSGKLPLQAPEINPERCVRCHGEPPMPIWNSYDADDGAIAPGIDGVRDGQEETDFTKFKELVETDPSYARYKNLAWKKEEPYFPFYKREKGEQVLVKDMPNLRLSTLLALGAAKIAAAKTRKSQNKYLSSLLAANQCNFPLADEKYAKKISRLIQALTGNPRETYILPKPKDKPDVTRFAGEPEHWAYWVEDIVFFRDSVRDALGMKNSDFSLTLEKGPTHKTIETGYFQNSHMLWAHLLLQDLAKKNGKIREALQDPSNTFSDFRVINEGTDPLYVGHLEESGAFLSQFGAGDERICEGLMEEMKKEMDEISEEEIACHNPWARADLTKFGVFFSQVNAGLKRLTSRGYQGIIKKNNCASCHDMSGFGSGPPIPFESKDEMKKYLREHPGFLTKMKTLTDPNHEPKKRMPKGRDALSPGAFQLPRRLIGLGLV